MQIDLTEAQRSAQANFHEYVADRITPIASELDRKGHIPAELIRDLGSSGHLGGLVPEKFGGQGMDALTWGLLCEEIGRASASLVSLLTVHSMVIQALTRWGSDEQKSRWLPKLATGETIAAFALSEPDVGSDAAHCQTEAMPDGDDLLLNGEKRWISFGQVADLFLVFGSIEGQSTAFLVESNSDGLGRAPISNMLGFRSAMLASLQLDNCRVPASNLVGRPGFGFSHVGGAALDHGRFCIAWGALGLIEACIAASLEYAESREQFGAPLMDHQLIKAMTADMLVQARASRLLCCNAARLKERGTPSLIMETSIAKYFSSRAAVQVALNAVQIHGANGCSEDYPVARYLRDAKVFEIIEGSNQIQQIIIAKYGQQERVKDRIQTTSRNEADE
jgi:alkylation response protein AidB-like acyl-CoA dehydrogenase